MCFTKACLGTPFLFVTFGSSIVLYHGSRKWVDKPLWKIFGEDIPLVLRKFIPEFECIVSDLGRYDDEKIKTLFDSFKLRAATFVMRDIYRKQFFRSGFEAALIELLKLKDNEEDTLSFLKRTDFEDIR